MRKIILCLVVLVGTLSAFADESKPIRIKLDWLNQAEMGTEGCKPRSVILPAGSFMSFRLSNRPGDPEFRIQAHWEETAIRLTLTKLSQKGSEEQKDQSVTATLPPDETHNLEVARYKFGVTAAEYVTPPKANPATSTAGIELSSAYFVTLP